MRYLVLSVDYEIFGNGSGDVRQHVTEPTARMCRIAEKYGVPVSIFFELEEFLAFEQNVPALRATLGYDPAALMRAQAADLSQRGHEFQLHLHPQWHNARLENNHWQLHWDKLTVDALYPTQEETNAYIAERKGQLEDLCGKPVNTYRAGGFAAQPCQKLLTALVASGFQIESSVVKGLHKTLPHPLDFRSAPANRRMWRISDDVCREDPAGPLWEIPVHSVMRWRIHQVSLSRLKAKFSRNVPREQKRDIVKQMGVKKTPMGLWRFLAEPTPIKLDFHNLSPAALHRMITQAPAAPPGDADVLVLIGHTKEHVNDAAFEQFLKLMSQEEGVRFVTFREIAEQLANARRSNPSVESPVSSLG